MTITSVRIVQGNETGAEDMQLAVSNPVWAQQASSALAAATRERVELQRAAVEAEDSIVRSALILLHISGDMTCEHIEAS